MTPIVLLLSLLGLAVAARGEDAMNESKPTGDEAPHEPADSGSKWYQFPMPTLGGKQFWADELHFHRWRIQRSTITGHYRLLDGSNRRHAAGTFEQCKARLEEVKREYNLPPMKGKAVIALHGLFRTRTALRGIASYLEENSDYVVFRVSYPSTQQSVEEHAQSLARIVENLDGIEEINFVAHSLGNLVIRRYLQDHHDPRIKRIVMLAPPNMGAQFAEKFADLEAFRFLTGDSGQQLTNGWDELEKKLATPKCEFGIIAGNIGKNPLVEGEDDLLVSVDETKLPGATDFIILPVLHTFMMDTDIARQHTLRFLQHGYFTSPERRMPILTDAQESEHQRAEQP